nr:DUF2837 family protein [Croceicoccus mobilis]
MDWSLVVICVLMAGINLIGTLAYASRIAGLRTGRIAVSFALFNVLVLLSRTANGFLAPFLAKRIETRLADGASDALLLDFHLILLSAMLAVGLGILLVPTGQRLFVIAISYLERHRSMGRVILRSASPAGLRSVRRSFAIPAHLRSGALSLPRTIGWKLIAANCFAQSLLTVGVLASLYAGFLSPEFRVTASQMSSVVNGFATILLFTFIDPQLSIMTDDVIEGRVGAAEFRHAIVWVSISRLAGTAIAQILLLPAARLIALIASVI